MLMIIIPCACWIIGMWIVLEQFFRKSNRTLSTTLLPILFLIHLHR